MNLSENLRRMRRDRCLTQEEISDALGVTYQAVSKWERGESYPDITLLPAIARYFGVTVDALLADKDDRAQEINKIKEEENRILFTEGSDAAREYLKTVLREYPDEWDLWLQYASYTGNGIRVNSNRPIDEPEGLNEAYEVLQRILRHCTDDKLRHNAKLQLAGILKAIGDKKAALEIINELPSIEGGVRDLMQPHFLEGDKQLTAIQSIFITLADMFWRVSRFVAQPDTFIYAEDSEGKSFGYTADERIKILEKGIGFLNLLTDDGEICQPWCYVYQYRNMAYIAAEDGQYSRALDYLEKAEYYSLVEVETGELYHSLLLNRLEKVKSSSQLQSLAWFIKSQEVFAPLRDDPRLKGIMSALDSVEKPSGASDAYASPYAAL